MQKIIFHIGVHRTGTSGLQAALAQSREMLLDSGICYPGDGNKHSHLAGAMRQPSFGPADLRAWLDENASCEAHTIILSCEDFTRAVELPAVKGLADHYDLSCIVYLRRQDDWLASWYAENKIWAWDYGHWASTVAQYLEAWRAGEFHWIDYAPLLDRWADAVGRDNMIVRVIGGNAQKDTGLDFIEVLGLPAVKRHQDMPNASPPAITLPFLSRFGPGTLQWQERHRLIAALSGAAAELGFSPSRIMFSPEMRREMRAVYAASNTRVAREWFGEDRLFDENGIDGDYVDLDALDIDALTVQIWPLVARRLAQRP